MTAFDFAAMLAVMCYQSAIESSGGSEDARDAMKKIALTKGKVALVDDADYEWLSQWKWCAHQSRDGQRWYAVRRTYGGPVRLFMKMHRVVMGVPSHIDVDHKNGNGLDNQRENLRVATKVQNTRNQKLRSTNTSGYKGVSRSAGRWAAVLYVDYTQIYIGCFDDKRVAARAYDFAAMIHFGEFARINFPRHVAKT